MVDVDPQDSIPLKIDVKNLTSSKLVDVHPKVLLQAHVDKVGLKAGDRVSQNREEGCVRQQPSHFVVVPVAGRKVEQLLKFISFEFINDELFTYEKQIYVVGTNPVCCKDLFVLQN